MTNEALILILIPVAYVAGAIPFGLIVGKAKGIDPRTSGSGNIGATNIGRLLGMKYFAIVFILDMLKGMLPMIAASVILAGSDRGVTQNLLHLLVGFAAICGHMFSVFIGFKGGKGVATSAGVSLGLFPYFTYPALVALATWGLVYAISRYVSLASMLAAVVFPIALIGIGSFMGWDVLTRQWPLLAFALLVAFLIVWRHRSNIARLKAGTETRFTGKAA